MSRARRVLCRWTPRGLSRVRILHWTEAFTRGVRLYEWESSPVAFRKDQLSHWVESALVRDLAVEDGGDVYWYRPHPQCGRVVEDVRIVRVKDQWADRFVFVANREILGPFIRENGTSLDNERRAVRAAKNSHKSDSRRTLYVEFAISFLETGTNFGHFLASHLPKLRYWVEGKVYSPDGPSILIPTPQEWQYSVLASLGVPRDKVVAVSADTECVVAGRFAMTDEKYLGGRSPALALENISWLREVLPEPTGAAANNAPLYLEREQSSRRVVLNSEAVRDVVERLGGVTVQPAFMSPSDQVSLVRSHRTVVGTNGTELLLTIFADRIRVISIVPPGPHLQGIVPAIVLASGHEFVPLVCTNDFEPNTPGDLRNMVAHIAELRAVLGRGNSLEA